MKTFLDLEFKQHPMPTHFGEQATISFDNGYGVSVINGTSAYCTRDTFEVAILFNNDITYSTDITDDVLGHQSPEEITEIMKRVQELK